MDGWMDAKLRDKWNLICNNALVGRDGDAGGGGGAGPTTYAK